MSLTIQIQKAKEAVARNEKKLYEAMHYQRGAWLKHDKAVEKHAKKLHEKKKELKKLEKKGKLQ